MITADSIEYFLKNRGGRQLTLRYITDSGFDVLDPTGPPVETEEDLEVYGYTANFKKKFYLGTNIKEFDIRCIIHAVEVQPSTDDRMVIDNIVYNIIKVRPIYDGENIILSEMILRG